MSMPVLIREGEVKTRKDHRCFGCGEKIPVGTEVYSSTCTGDGCIYTLYLCTECREFMTDYPDLCEDYDGIIWEGRIGEARQEFEADMAGKEVE
ncbi:MAG: hypothetical protein QME44_04545 [Thermodesulfobacteriota bacterium]|nr:hypothetical protein [Thermodesulfobacteriota bacterium]